MGKRKAVSLRKSRMVNGISPTMRVDSRTKNNSAQGVVDRGFVEELMRSRGIYLELDKIVDH
jgi:hypothetical protein